MNSDRDVEAAARLPVLGQGFYWQELTEGAEYRTYRRTITETDLVSFINCTGMLEVLFIDEAYEGRMIDGRLVPAALTYSLIEGMQMQTICQGTGMALLEVSQRAHAPVFVGDSIWATVRVGDVRPTSKGGRAVARFRVEIFNQHGTLVLGYDVARLIAGKPE